jgi:hypothetical protein
MTARNLLRSLCGPESHETSTKCREHGPRDSSVFGGSRHADDAASDLGG